MQLERKWAIPQIFFAAACFAMFLRYGVKYDIGLGYREVILMLAGTTLLNLFFIKKIKLYLETELFFIIGIPIIVSFLLSDIKAYGIAEIFVFFTAANTILITSQLKNTKILEWGLILTASVLSIYGLYHFAFNSDIRVISNIINPLAKAQGFPNAVAMFLLVMWPYVGLKITESKLRLQNILNIGILGLIIAALYLTFSRGAYIAFIIQLIILAYFNYKYFLLYKYKWIIAIIVGAVFISLTLFIRSEHNIQTYDIGDKLTFSNNENITSIEERSDFFRITLGLILEKPIFGYGPQTFRFIYPSKQELLYANSDHPHNIFLKTAFESGVVCAALLIVFFVLIAVKSIKKSTPQKNFMAVAIFGGLAHNMIDYNLNFLLIYIVFAITLGLLINQINEGKAERLQQKFQITKKAVFLAFCAISVILSLVGIRDYFNTDPYSDFQTIKRYTSSELESHISKYSKSLYPREFWIQLSDYYFLKNDLSNAMKMVEEHIKINPHDIYGPLNKGRILYDLKKYDEAILSFKQALQIDPKNSLAVHYYYLKTLKAINQSPPDEYLDKMLYPIIEDFMFYAKNNLHFVSMKPEIKHAQCIIEILESSGDIAKDWNQFIEKLNLYKQKYNKNGYQYDVCF
ncbi:O-antigen ligase family protein [Candidatus Peregrinibacteria bacterium]|nr:O-antigen ligase family protein [Candidatus Peregrinibacteria bacterium]